MIYTIDEKNEIYIHEKNNTDSQGEKNFQSQLYGIQQIIFEKKVFNIPKNFYK